MRHINTSHRAHRPPLGSRTRYATELLETRTLLSQYTFNSISLPSVFPNGQTPSAPLVIDASGNLFGTTAGGGAYGDGTVFEIAHGNPNVVMTLASFNGTDGENPSQALTLDINGDVFGTTGGGGTAGAGTIFELLHGSMTNIVLIASFSGEGSDTPLCIDSSGDLFGAAYYLNSQGFFGSVFEVSHTATNTITAIDTFGAVPNQSSNYPSALAIDSSGNLYGEVFAGVNFIGSVFEINHASLSTVNTLYSFTSSSTGNFATGLTVDSGGNLFGVSENETAAGAIFELPAMSRSSIQLLATFPERTLDPISGNLTVDSNDNIFGTSSGDPNAVNDSGSVFEIARGSGTISTLATFDGIDGESAQGGVVIDPSGNLFGTASAGAGSNGGDVFEVPRSNRNLIVVLDSFNSTGGLNPAGTPVLDSSGNLYGETSVGSNSGFGTVFEVQHATNAITTLAGFTGSGTTGANPAGGLTIDSAGDLFGVTTNGGTYGDGTVFELVNGSSMITTLASFSGTNGLNPVGGLVMDSSGDLFGMTPNGGANGDGVVFEVAKTNPTLINPLASFNGSDGMQPGGGLTLDSTGDLFGTTKIGGLGYGNVFEISATAPNTIVSLASFDAFPGGNFPVAAPTLNSLGDLFGTTESGGENDYGILFEVSHTSPTTITSLLSFDGNNGASPVGKLVFDQSGNIFGTTERGGNGNGNVFEIASDSPTTITTLLNLNRSTGELTDAGLALDSAGNLFGTTPLYGASGAGTVFELASTGTATSVSVTGTSAVLGQTGPVRLSAAVTASPTPGEGIVTFSLVPPGAAVASQTFTAAVSGGVATASINVSSLSAGTYTLQAGYSDPNGTYAGSIATPGTLVISSGAASKLAFAQPPTGTSAGTSINPAITVAVQSSAGSTVTSDKSPVTLTISGGFFSTGSTTAAVSAVNGVATFAILRIDSPGSYTLTATDPGLTAATSNGFTISAPPRVLSIVRNFPSGSTAADGSVTYLVTFSAPVTNVLPGDFVVTGGSTLTAAATVTMSPGSGSSATYLVTVSGISGYGTLGLNLVDGSGGGIVDSNGSHLADSSGTYLPQTAINVGTQPYAVASADLNGDGKTDLVEVNRGDNSVSVLLGNGNGTFSAPVTYVVGSTPDSVAIADTNGDGTLDLVVADYVSNQVSVLLGTGTGTFGTAMNYSVGTNPQAVVVADLNGDGRPDVVTANLNGNAGNGSASVLLGTTAGTLGPAVTFSAGLNPFSVAIGDVNGDGKPDLAVDDISSGIDIFPGNGDGSFGTPTSYAGGSLPVGVALADVNHDGKLDLLNSEFGGAEVDEHLNTGTTGGSVSFGAEKDLPVGSRPEQLVLQDINGDGNVDLVSTDNAGADITVQLGNGDGTFQTPYTVPTGNAARGIVAADFNGDGTSDLVTTDETDNTINVLIARETYVGQTYTITNPEIISSGTTTLPAGTVAGTTVYYFSSINIAAGASLVIAPSTVAGARTLIVTPSLTLSGSTGMWTSTLDLSNNDLDVTGGSLATLNNQVMQGFNLAGGGNWAGNGGIVSSSAASDTTHLTALGVIQNNQGGTSLFGIKTFDGSMPGASDILVKYTYYGDSNLSGNVDGSDYSLIDGGDTTPGKTGWYNGDYNYDGVVDGSDYALIDNAFNNQKAAMPSASVATETALVARAVAKDHTADGIKSTLIRQTMRVTPILAISANPFAVGLADETARRRRLLADLGLESVT